MSAVIDLTIDSDSAEDGSASHHNELIASRINDEDYECGSVLEVTGLVVLTW